MYTNNNIFELLDDENDEEGSRKNQQQAAPSNKQAAPAVKGTKTPVSAPTKEQPRKDSAAPVKASGPPKERLDKRPQRTEGERSERPDRRRTDGSAPPAGGERSDRGDRPPRVQEGGRGRRDNKENRDSQGFRPNKRPFDRRSGTGRGKEVKKGGGGRANWGKEEVWEENPEKQSEEVKPEAAKSEPTEVVVAVPAEPVKEETEEEKKRREEEEQKHKEEEEKEARQITLEDYLKKKEAEKAEKPSIIPELPAPRKPGEGVDKKELQKWAQFTALKRDEEEDKPSGDSKKDKKKEPKKQALPLDSVLKVQAPKKPRPGRPDRPEGNPDRSSPRGNKRRTGAAPDVRDASSFPALTTKA
jgi:plasminogen activator inhibitor 1 RNA-binding protein